MTYQERINTFAHFSMSDVINISKDLLPAKHRRFPWKCINHGIDLLHSEEQLCAYMAAYGEMHYIKCKVSFQNFNFESLATNIEIVDWGCGQGIGTLTFIEMLKERDKLHLLKRVTLIEPSLAALERATLNVQKITNGSILVLSINKYLPGNGENNEIEGMDFTQSNVVHIFSNILDIPAISLEKLVCIVGVPNRVHYIMCMGPKNTNSYRIAKFCSAFNVDEDAYFSKIDNPCYGHTSDTNHNFSCVTRCFRYNGEGINLNEMKKIVEPTLICGKPIYDDYDPMLAVQNNVISKGIFDFYSYLGKKLNDTDYVYLKPDINGDTPDIVIVRPNAGIVVVKVVEEDIWDYEFYKNDKQEPDYNVIYHKANRNISKSSPVTIVKSYQNNLIQLHIKDMVGKSLTDKRYWSAIKTVAYFSKNTTSEAKKKFQNLKANYTVILGNDIFDKNDFDIIEAIKIKTSSHYFDEQICNSFLRILSPQWHSYKQGKHISLTNQQKKLAKSEAKARHKINGVAGSGKTQVLATRAVNANLRTGKKVLVLTFNLSLVNYIKHRIGQVRADFSWQMFFIVNYHQFFIAEANNHGLKMNLTSFEDLSFFEHVSKNIKKYSTILIDEVQDYQTPWLKILDKYFLEPDGEIVVFGDAKQNIYSRALDNNGQVNIGFIPGEWNNSLSKGFRFNNPQLTSLAVNFQKEFFPSLTADVIQQNIAISFDTNIKYYYVGKNVPPKTMDENCRWIMKEYNLDPRNVVILSQTCDILRDLDHAYRSSTRCNTMTTFETKEQYDALKQEHRITEEKSPITFNFRSDIKQIRRNKKVHFSMDSSELKLSTIHSYKGWEAQTVILILEAERNGEKEEYTVGIDENTPELIYTAITRCKENLFIINRGNEKYHEFFNKNSN